MVLSSEVTLVECDRVLLRAQAAGDLAAPALAVQRRRLRSACAHWTLFPLQAEIVERARQGFPHEPVRTLDAIHLATLVVARALVSDLHLLSFDERIILNARGMGFPVVA